MVRLFYKLTANSLFQVPAALSTVEGRNFYRFYQNQLDGVLVQHLREEGDANEC
jgi:hypothetical protein